MTDSTEFPKEQIEAFRRAAKRQRQLWEAIEVLRNEAQNSGLASLCGAPELDSDPLRNTIRTVLREIDAAARSGGNLAIKIARPPGRPRTSLLITREATRLHNQGIFYPQIADSLNRTCGEGTTYGRKCSQNYHETRTHQSHSRCGHSEQVLSRTISFRKFIFTMRGAALTQHQ